MNRPDLDPRYMTADGCVEMAREMDRLADSARLLVERHAGWSRALRSRAEKIDKAECLEAEAKVERIMADRVANQERKPDALADVLGDCFKLVSLGARR